MDEWDEAEERAERIAELMEDMSESLRAIGVNAYAWEIQGDILVEGGLKAIVEWAHDWRSEIEELD